MIYVYDADNRELEILSKFNLKNKIIIIDEEFCYDAQIDKKKGTFKEILLSDIDIGDFTGKTKKKDYPIEIKFGKNQSKLNISKDIITEMMKKIGFLKMLFLKNPVYNIEGFLISIQDATSKKVLIKTGKTHRIFLDGKLLTIENVYEMPEMKLWENTDEYSVIFK